MSTQLLAEKVEELAILVMLLHAQDKPGFEMICSSCQDLALLIEPLSSESAVAARAISARKGECGEPFIDELRSFVASLQSLVAGNASQSAPATSETAGWRSEISDFFDADLVKDFIETHTIKLDEFEAALVNAATGSADSEIADINQFCRAYLHNIKGDAGTVGLKGIEKVTHHVEDMLGEDSAVKLSEQLLAFRGWILSSLSELVRNTPAPSEPADAFLARIEAMRSREQSPGSATTRATSRFTAEGYEITGDMEVLVEFMAEAEEHLGKVEEILLDREDGFSVDDVGSIFRAVHSIKGGSSYFNLLEMTRTSHILENLLDRSRKGQLEIDATFKGLILRYVDIQKRLFERAKTAMKGDRGLVTAPEVATLLVDLEQVLTNGSTAASANTKASISAPSDSPAAVSVATEQKPLELTAVEAKAPADTTKGEEKLDVKTFVKVDTTRLDRLIEYIGEMVISSSMLIKNCRDLLSDNEGVIANTHQLEQISREIQGIGMSMRLVPIKGLLQKMSRLVWDTSKKIGKEITFRTEGEDTELDRTVIDRLADPLMHMIRNSVDHGVEPPEDRIAKGKPRGGTVTVSASHHGGSIHIKIIDDGRGMDPAKLLKKAREKGIVPPEQAFSEEEIFQFIFLAGFSTAEKVTDISGRGVGMDVVRRNIEAMRGRVHIESKLGVGTTFTIELPLTLAIIDGIETAVGQERFIIPTHSVVEFVKPRAGSLLHALDSSEAFEFRGKHLPLFRVSDLFEMNPRHAQPEDAILAVVENNRDSVALMLDEVIGSYSTVIKPLGPTFSNVRGLSGCAIMPDGTIGLILDVATLVEMARSKKIARRPVENFEATEQQPTHP